MPVYVATLSVDILTSSVAAASVITTRTTHGFSSGDSVDILGHVGSTPSIDGTHVITKLSDTTFSIPVNVTVAGSAGTVTKSREIKIETLHIDDVVNEATGGRVGFICDDGSFRPAVGSEFIVTEDATRIFAGFVEKATEYGLDDNPGATFVTEIEADSYFALLEHERITITFAAGTLKSQLLSLVAAQSVGITLDAGQVNGPAMVERAFDNATLDEILKDFSERSAFVRRVDYFKVLSMFDPTTNPAPVGITLANRKALGDVRVERTRRDYANKVTVLGGEGYNQNIVNEIHTATAAQTKFLLEAPMYYFGTVVLRIVRSGVPTIELVDGVAWTYQASDYSINKGTAAAMGAGDTLQVGPDGLSGYSAWYPMRISATDSTYATNPRELVVSRPDMFNREAMQALADSLLVRALEEEIRVEYSTKETGLFPGQTQSIVLADRDVNDDFTILSVTTRNVKGNEIRRFVVAVSGDQARPTSEREVYRRWLSDETRSGATENTIAPVGTSIPIGPAGSNEEVQSNDYGKFYADSKFKHVRDSHKVVVEHTHYKTDIRGATTDASAYGVPGVPAAISAIAKTGDKVLLALGHTNPGLANALTATVYSGSGDITFEFDDITLAFFGYGTGGEIQLSANLLNFVPGDPSAYRTLLRGLNQPYGLQPRTQRITASTHTIDTGLSEANMTTGYIYAGSAAGTFTLPSLSAFNVFNNSHFPRLLFIKNDSSYVLTLDGDSTDTIDGWLTYPMLPGWSVALLGWGGTGSKWQILHAFKPPIVRTLTDSEIKALPTTGIDVVPAPGSGFRVKPLGVSLQINNSGGDYTNINATYAALYIMSSPGNHHLATPLWEDPAYGLSQITDLLAGSNGRKYADLAVPFVLTHDGATFADGTYISTQPTTAGTSEVDNDAIAIVGDNNGSGNWTGGNGANVLRVSIQCDVEATP